MCIVLEIDLLHNVVLKYIKHYYVKKNVSCDYNQNNFNIIILFDIALTITTCFSNKYFIIIYAKYCLQWDFFVLGLKINIFESIKITQ